MRRALSITLFAVVTLVAATPAAAQQPPARTSNDGQSLGLRYLSWPGRTTPARTTPERPAATPTRPGATAASTPASSRRPTPAIIPHGTPPRPAATGSMPAPAHGLTPANAWMSSPVPTPAQTTPTPSAPPSAMAPPPTSTVSTGPVLPATVDPMAPRRDALIFRMQGSVDTTPAATPQPQAQPATVPSRTPVAASSNGPAEQGARYYSVHRQNNRQPDPTPLPATTYVDAIAVDLPASLASQDLAAPPEPPALVRNAQGRLQAMPDTSTPDQL